MSAFWRLWFMIWCASLGVFGLLLAGGAIEATSAPVRLMLSVLQGDGAVAFDPPLRFSLAVLGAVSFGWAVTLFLMIGAAIDLGSDARPFWNAITAGMVSWFAIDSALSLVTGFGLNVLPNIALAGMYLTGLIGSGIMKQTS